MVHDDLPPRDEKGRFLPVKSNRPRRTLEELLQLEVHVDDEAIFERLRQKGLI